jgi:protein-tyrosine-phosphatase
MTTGVPSIVTLCTGNAARSVMAEFMFEYWGVETGVELEVVSAGTHVVEGQPMGMRTRAALASISALGELAVWGHRSKQLSAEHLRRADLVVAMEADHVRFVRRHHPEAAARCATLRRLCIDLKPSDEPLTQRIAVLGLADLPLDSGEDVADPAGGEVEDYVVCANELWSLTEELTARLRGSVGLNTA